MQEKLRLDSKYADSIGMKTEFQKILESQLAKQEVASKASSSPQEFDFSSQTLHTPIAFLKLDRPPKYFGVHLYKKTTSSFTNFCFEKIDPSSSRALIAVEKEYLQQKTQWILSLKNDSPLQAIEFFFSMGARKFLSRKTGDLKRDFKKIALLHHPDRVHLQQTYSEKQCEEIFKSLSEHYQILIKFTSL